MNAVTRTTQTATNALVALIVAVLALFAVPTRAVASVPGTATQFTALAAGSAPVLRFAHSRKTRVHPTAAVAQPPVPPALPTAAIFVALSLVLLAVLRPVVRRLRTVTAFRLPAVRAPPQRLA
jgi:hypothetical protein